MTDLSGVMAADARLAEEARNRAEKATPGPWTYDTYGTAAFVFHGSKEEAICDLDYSQDDAGPDEETVLRQSVRANAAMIAAARTDIPALAARLTAYREALEIAIRHFEEARSVGLMDISYSEAEALLQGHVHSALAEVAAKLAP